jgi:hypothetical protein
MVNQAQRQEDAWGTGGIAPRIAPQVSSQPLSWTGSPPERYTEAEIPYHRLESNPCSSVVQSVA